jgi:chromosome segregation ATPase
MDENTRQKFEDARSWLLDLLGSDELPPIELNKATIEFLYALMQQSCVAERRAELLLEYYENCRQEYKHDQNRLSSIMQSFGLTSDDLSSSGKKNLTAIADCANELDVADPLPSSMLMAASVLTEECINLKSELRTVQLEVEALEEKRRQLSLAGANWSRKKHELAEEWKERQESLAQYANNTKFLHQSVNAYRSRLNDLKKKIAASGVTPDLIHQRLVQDAADIQAMLAAGEKDEQLLQSFQSLPPNVWEAELVVQQRREYLQKLSEQLATAVSNIV